MNTRASLSEFLHPLLDPKATEKEKKEATEELLKRLDVWRPEFVAWLRSASTPTSTIGSDAEDVIQDRAKEALVGFPVGEPAWLFDALRGKHGSEGLTACFIRFYRCWLRNENRTRVTRDARRRAGGVKGEGVFQAGDDADKRPGLQNHPAGDLGDGGRLELDEFLSGLDDFPRQVIRLRCDGRTYAEVAKELGCSVGVAHATAAKVEAFWIEFGLSSPDDSPTARFPE